MRTEEIIIRLFCMGDDKLAHVNKRKNAHLYRSRDCHDRYPVHPQGRALPCVLSLAQRGLAAYEPLTDQFLVAPQEESVIDSYGIELIHPIRQGRSPAQIGKKGISNHRWIVGVKLCWLITPQGQIIDWGWATANTHDQHLREVGERWTDQTEVLSDLASANAGTSRSTGAFVSMANAMIA